MNIKVKGKYGSITMTGVDIAPRHTDKNLNWSSASTDSNSVLLEDVFTELKAMYAVMKNKG